MPDDSDPTATRRLLLLQWMHAPEPDRAAAWAALHRAGLVSEREPGPNDELPLLKAAE